VDAEHLEATDAEVDRLISIRAKEREKADREQEAWQEVLGGITSSVVRKTNKPGLAIT
jgi:hypothetical protein